MLASDRSVLKVYVFGSTEGESIVLRLPDGNWGVVDSFASSLRDPATNPALTLLTQEGVREIAFLCLTHPHADHFRGMSQILQGVRVRQFWTFIGPDPNDVVLLKTFFQAEAEQANRQVLNDSAEELAAIFDLAHEKGIGREYVISRRVMYPVPSDGNVAVEISAIAPTSDRVTAYRNEILKNMKRMRGKVQAVPHVKHNEISIGLRITFGKARVILGGDVEEKAWVSILGEQAPKDLAAHFVKVSHHGSTTGYCPGLWEVLSGNGSSRPIAALTPYRRFGLPDPLALDHIREHARSIHSASRSGHAERSENWRLTALARLKAASEGRLPASETDATVGCCEVEINDQGECRVTHHEQACVIWEEPVDLP